MATKLLYQRRKFNRKLSIVRLELLRTKRRVSVGRILIIKNTPLAIEDSEANNFIEQLRRYECIDTANPSDPSYFVFPDGVPLYRRVNELSVWQAAGPVEYNSIGYYKRSVRLARANLVSVMSGAMAMLDESTPRTAGNRLRKIASAAERIASSTLGDFDKLCSNSMVVDGMCTNENIGYEWQRIQQILTDIYLQFDSIELQSKHDWN